MSDKQIKLTLAWGINQYEVKTITNTTRYKPGQWLSVAEVEELCKSPNWDILISDDQTILQLAQMVFGVVSKEIPIPKL